MKAIRMRIQKFSRPGVILMATVVAIITSIVVANATQTITTPNAAFISYSLLGNVVGGTNSAPITPATNRSVLVMGCTTLNDDGVGQVSLLHTAGVGMTWVGLNMGTSTTGGFRNGTPGTHIVWIDGDHGVDIRVASADTILIHNGEGSTRTGNVTLVW